MKVITGLYRLHQSTNSCGSGSGDVAKRRPSSPYLAGVCLPNIGSGSSGTFDRRREFRVLATSASIRPRGFDYQALTLSNLSTSLALVVGKSAVLVAAEASIEFNAFAERALQRANDGEDEEEIDLVDLQKRHTASFVKYLYKNLITEAIKKLYEYLAKENISPKLFDRLTKDPIKSAARKLLKSKSAFSSAQRMWSTFLWSKSILYASFFTYDVVTAVVNYAANPKRKPLQLKKIVAWIGNKVTSYAFVMLGTATGFSIGIYLFPNYGGHVGPILGEVAASALVAEFLM